jgi:16S rRNA (cytosine967-C5)-methyltransferase
VFDEGHAFSVDGPAFAGLSAEDRGLARAIAGTALRRHGQIAAALGALIAKPLGRRAGLLPMILEVAAAQILFMEVPDHAAVSVALAAAEADPKGRHFKPLANAVLRELVRRRDEILAGQDETVLNTPGWLRQRWARAYGAEGAAALAKAHLREAPLDIGVKSDAAEWARQLGGTVLPTGTVRLDAKGRIEAIPGYEEGGWWVQDAAAALPARLLGDVSGKIVLDLCAAPGGKTVQLALAGAHVTAVDADASRIDRLKGNLQRLRIEAECVVADALTYDPNRQFDAVLLDAPCSATGTVRRHPDIPWLKQEGDVTSVAALQRRLMEKAAALTKPGGTLVFATCSLEPEEGEEQAERAAHILPLEPWPVSEADIPGARAEWFRGGYLRTLAFHSAGTGADGGMDGFFAARFRRR